MPWLLPKYQLAYCGVMPLAAASFSVLVWILTSQHVVLCVVNKLEILHLFLLFLWNIRQAASHIGPFWFFSLHWSNSSFSILLKIPLLRVAQKMVSTNYQYQHICRKILMRVTSPCNALPFLMSQLCTKIIVVLKKKQFMQDTWETSVYNNQECVFFESHISPSTSPLF